jgi:hypothetical protein
MAKFCLISEPEIFRERGKMLLKLDVSIHEWDKHCKLHMRSANVSDCKADVEYHEVEHTSKTHL